MGGQVFELAAEEGEVLVEAVAHPGVFQLDAAVGAIGRPLELVGQLLVDDVAGEAELDAAEFKAVGELVVFPSPPSTWVSL